MYRALGTSGLAVSRIGLGLAALGRPGYINLGHAEDTGDATVEVMRAHCRAVLDAAWAAGIRYVDAARSYGRAEEFLAGWLIDRLRPPGAITVGSKWGYVYTAGWRVDAERHEVKDHSAATFRRQLMESRSLLHGHLALYQVHSATADSGVLENAEVLDALAAARDHGLVIGVTVSGPDQPALIERAAQIRRGGDRLFATVQATWNLLEPSAGPALAAAHDAGVGVIVKEALANGRLTGRDPSSPVDDAGALAAALAQPWADVVLSGAATVSQLESNLRALAIDPTESPDPGDLAEPPAQYWARRAELPWT